MGIDNIEIKISCDECKKDEITESIILCQECEIIYNQQASREKIDILLAAFSEIQNLHLTVSPEHLLIDYYKGIDVIIERAKKAVEIPGEAKKILTLSREYLQELDDAYKIIMTLEKVNKDLQANFKQLRLRLEKSLGDGYKEISINEVINFIKLMT